MQQETCVLCGKTFLKVEGNSTNVCLLCSMERGVEAYNRGLAMGKASLQLKEKTMSFAEEVERVKQLRAEKRARPHPPRDDEEREAFDLRDKSNLQVWCGKQNMDDPRIILCTRFRGHDGDHVTCCEDYPDGRPGVVIARWNRRKEIDPTPRLALYLKLENIVLLIDKDEILRKEQWREMCLSVMDDVWQRLSEEELKFLDERTR